MSIFAIKEAEEEGTMKRMLKSDLARIAGVSLRTFERWMQQHREDLEKRGVKPGDRLVSPQGIKYICDAYGIDEEELGK